MKKILLIILTFIAFSNVSAAELVRCIDGDTAVIMHDNKQETVRFLAIDTPEYTKEKEPYGLEASNFTCEALTNAKTIRIELDKNSDKYDKYKRLLAWIFVDEKLLQEELLKNGLAEIKYIYGDYSYLDKLESVELIAKTNNLGIWGEYKTDYTYLILLTLLIVLLLIIFKGDIKKTRRYMKKIIK